jgi:hypothetical protein
VSSGLWPGYEAMTSNGEQATGPPTASPVDGRCSDPGGQPRELPLPGAHSALGEPGAIFGALAALAGIALLFEVPANALQVALGHVQ